MERSASVYQVYPVSRTTSEGRAAFSRAWGHGFEQEGAVGGVGGGEGRGNSKMCVETITILQGDKSDGFRRNAPVNHVYPVSRTTSEERAECSRGWVGGGGGRKRVLNSFRSHRCRGLQYASYYVPEYPFRLNLCQD